MSEAIAELKSEFAERESAVAKVDHQHYGNPVEYAIPAFAAEIRIFPVDQSFVDYLLPEIYTLGNISKEQLKIFDQLMMQLEIDSFIIEVPESLSVKNQVYLIKLLEIALGGQYSKPSDISSHGVLNKREQIYIKSFRKEDEDIIDQLEKLLEKYTV